VITSRASRDSTAAAYPLPVPISRTRSVPVSSRAEAVAATMNGAEIVWPHAIGSGPEP
jgi:hypothetical protein